MYLSKLCRDRYSKNAMVLLPCPFSSGANSSSFIPSDLIPIALIRDPGFLPHIPIILFWIPAFPVISSHVRVVPTVLSHHRFILPTMCIHRWGAVATCKLTRTKLPSISMEIGLRFFFDLPKQKKVIPRQGTSTG